MYKRIYMDVVTPSRLTGRNRAVRRRRDPRRAHCAPRRRLPHYADPKREHGRRITAARMDDCHLRNERLYAPRARQVRRPPPACRAHHLQRRLPRQTAPRSIPGWRCEAGRPA